MAKRYIFDLDLAAEKRWLLILEDFKDKIPKLKLEIDKIFKNLGIGSVYQTTLYYLVRAFEMTGYMLYAEEIRSISNFSGIDFEKVVIMQLYYEMTSACTSIVTQVNNKSAFFRTMDWDFDLLRELTIELDVRRNGKTQFLATTWVGCVGLYTFTIPDKYSLAINYRRTNNIDIKSMLSNALRIMTMYWPTSYLLRYIAESNLSNGKLDSILKRSLLVSPTYIIVCYHDGVTKPAIYIRDYDKLVSRYTNDYVIQTNCDHDKFEPNILCSIQRRELVERIIRRHSNNFASIEEMFISFVKEPIINEDTIYVTLIGYENDHLIYQSIVN